ncbi:MAG: urea ABC transporter permease subunit UrtB [Pseudomonadota bacterium]
MNLLTRACLCLSLLFWGVSLQAQNSSAIQDLLQEHQDLIDKSSRKSIGPAIDALAASDLAEAQQVLERWQAKELWMRKEDGLFFYTEPREDNQLALFDIASGAEVGLAGKRDLKQIKPNSGIRGMIGAALVRFQLTDPDPAVRSASLNAIERDPEATHLAVLRTAIDDDPDAAIRARKERLERLLTIRFDEDTAIRVAAIESFRGDLGVDVRATLNPLVATRSEALQPADYDPEDPTIAGTLTPGESGFGQDDAYALLVDQGLAEPLANRDDLRKALTDNIVDGQVGGIEVAALGADAARDLAYAELARQGLVAPRVTADQAEAILTEFVFVERFLDQPEPIISTTLAVLQSIEQKVAVNQFADLVLDALSLASIYFLAAIGLAITFGVMGVINMAHGEFIMMGAYTGYVVQLFVPDYTVSILIALPAAFLVTFSAGVAMERLVIRWLYHRPLETLLATFGISIALQQLAKNIFGTQARPLTAPDWLGGAFILNDVVSISYIRIAIFVMALMFLAVFLFIMRRTRLGLEVRAVTQNPRMAASMGINPDRINMLTFGIGSGIAGVAGVTIGLFAKVTSEMGQDYIVQSFMTVVVGGVGNIWGTLLGATLVGFLQKGIEWFNPSNTLAAQTYMILFIILFIQFRPRGIIALKGRAAEA